MLAGTHICLPLLVAGLWDWTRVRRHRPALFSRTQLYGIAIGGLLPDLFSLHLSLDARHASPTHTIWFPLALLPFLLVAGLPRQRRLFPALLVAWMGVVLHLGADLVSGGIPLRGVGTPIVGQYYIPPPWWWVCDCIVILITWFVFFRNRWIASGGSLESPTCSWEEKILAKWRRERQPVGSEPPPPTEPG